MTYSVVAVDPSTGEVGAAVHSSVLAIGRAVPWVRAGVGAVATQSFTLRRYGPRGLDGLAAGGVPTEVLGLLLAADDGRETRQVGLVDIGGRTAGWTGSACVASAGMLAGNGWRVQGNMLATDDVVPAMAEAFVSSSGPLAERLIATLAAAEPAGGDLRGRQSAGLLVAGGPADDDPEQAVTVDLRVDDAPNPHAELARLLSVQRALERLAPRGDPMTPGEQAAANEAVADVSPPRLAAFHRATAAALRGDDAAALAAWAGLERTERWLGYLRSMTQAGRLPGGDRLLEIVDER